MVSDAVRGGCGCSFTLASCPLLSTVSLVDDVEEGDGLLSSCLVSCAVEGFLLGTTGFDLTEGFGANGGCVFEVADDVGVETGLGGE